MNRPIFLVGWRRLLVQFDIHAAEAIAVIGLLAVIIGALLLSVIAGARANALDCPPPGEHQVLVWSWAKGAASCQYIDRSERQ